MIHAPMDNNNYPNTTDAPQGVGGLTTDFGKLIPLVVVATIAFPSVLLWSLVLGAVEVNVGLFQFGQALLQPLTILFYLALTSFLVYSSLRPSTISKRDWLARHTAFIFFTYGDFILVFLLPFILLEPGAKYGQPFPTASGDILLALIVFDISLFFRYFALSALGQRYAGLQGISPKGIAALASLGEVQLQANLRMGLDYVRRSVRLGDEYLSSNGMRLKQTSEVLATIFTLETNDQVPFQQAIDLAHGLSFFPDIERVSDSMTTFLRGLQWPSAIVSVETEKKSNYEKLAVAAAILAGLGTFLPDTYRQGFISALLSSTAAVVVVALILAAFSLVMIRRVVRSVVDPVDLYRYWTRLKPLEAVDNTATR